MQNHDETEQPKSALNFRKGATDALGDVAAGTDWSGLAQVARGQITDALGARHLSFLLGSGCSSFVQEDKKDDDTSEWNELGIPTMGPLAKEFMALIGEDANKNAVTNAEKEKLESALGIDISEKDFSENLERLMEVLLATIFFSENSSLLAMKGSKENLESIVEKVVAFVTEVCSKPELSEPSNPVHALYRRFYQKLVLRDRTLPRPWVFTTNYDLFSEQAMDRLSIPYCNGFTGSVERRFNPANFRYSIAEQLDITSKRWAAVDSFVYLCKLHGSINWLEAGDGLFPIRELQAAPPRGSGGRVMIYPTPAKQNMSFGAPYSDLFREFQKQVVQDQSVLITAGYGFGDEHVNNIIFQALTIPGFRLIVFAKPDTNKTTKTLYDLSDPRVWFVWGEGPEGGAPAHYFKTVVEHLLPDGPGGRIDNAVEKAMQAIVSMASDAKGDNADA